MDSILSSKWFKCVSFLGVAGCIFLVLFVHSLLFIHDVYSVLLLYLHVPFAILSYLMFLSCIITSILQILRSNWNLEYGMLACGEVGIILGILVLFSGSFWSSAQWGQFWVWEPRTTSMLVTVCIFFAWRLLNFTIKSLARKTRTYISASTAILGFPCIVLTHFAVKLFGGIHPEVLRNPGATDAFTVRPLIFSLCALFVLVILAVLTRYQVLKAQDTAMRVQAQLDFFQTEC